MNLKIYKINKIAKDPEKITKNIFKFFSYRDYEIGSKKDFSISSGFMIDNIIYNITPSDCFRDFNCVASSFFSENPNLDINVHYVSKDIQDTYFPIRYKILPKNTCIFYLTIVSYPNEENIVFNVIDKF